jgi:hypothetical protein
VRVLFLQLDPAYTGRTREFGAAARGLVSHGHLVSFACPEDSECLAALDDGVGELIRLRVSGGRLAVILRLRRVLAERFIEVILVHSEQEQIVAAAAARLAGRAAVVRRVPPGELPVAGRDSRIAARAAATGWLFASEEDESAAGELSARLAPMRAPAGVVLEDYAALPLVARGAIGPAAADQLIVCAHDHTGRYRAAVALRAMALLSPLHPTLGMVFIGPGSTDQDLRIHAAALGINRHVAFLGPRLDAPVLVRAADIGWITAAGDDAVLSLLDLHGYGIPALVPRDSVGRRYLVDGVSGVLIGDDPHAAAAVLARLLADPRARATMGRAAHAALARRWSHTAMADAYHQAVLAAGDRSQWSS